MALAVALAVGSSAPARGDEFRVADPAPPAAFIERAVAFRRAALETLARDWGLEPGAIPIRWSLVATIPDARADAASLGRTRGRTYFCENGVEVELAVQAHLARPEKLGAVVVHEAAHAVLASRLGADRCAEIPRWFREGFALHIAGETSARLAAAVVDRLIDGDGDGGASTAVAVLLVGLESDSRTSDVEGALAIAGLARARGRSAPAELIALLARGRGWRASVEHLYGQELATALASWSRLAAGELAREASEAAVRALDVALAALESGDPTRAIELLDRDDLGALAEPARYFRARAFLDAGDPSRALRLLEPILETRVESPWEPGVLVAIARARGALGATELAAATARECLERFPDDRASCSAARGLLARFAEGDSGAGTAPAEKRAAEAETDS